MKRFSKGITIVLIVTLLLQCMVPPDGLPFQYRKASAKAGQNTKTRTIAENPPAAGTEGKNAGINGSGTATNDYAARNLSSNHLLSKTDSQSGKINPNDTKKTSMARAGASGDVPNPADSGNSGVIQETEAAAGVRSKSENGAVISRKDGNDTDTAVNKSSESGNEADGFTGRAGSEEADGFAGGASSEEADIQAPGVPENLAVTEITAAAATISWLPSTDDVGISGYEVYQDSVIIGTADVPTFTVVDLLPGKTYYFTVAAKDLAGNKSAESESLEVTLDSPSDTYNSADIIDDLSEEALLVRNAVETVSGTAGPAGNGADTLKEETNPAGDRADSSEDAAGSAGGSANSAEEETNPYDNTGNPADDMESSVDDKTESENEAADPADAETDPAGKETETTDNTNGQADDMAGLAPEGENTETGAEPEEETDEFGEADEQAPTAPGNLAAAVVSGPAIHLTWEASTDDTGIDSYEIYCNDELTASTTAIEYTFSGPEPGVTYRFYVTACDAAGNVSEPSNTVNVTADDTQSPSAPANLTVAAAGTEIILTWEPSTDNVGVTGYDIFQDTVWIASTAGENTYTVTGLTPGVEYTFTVKARDGAGNVSEASNAVTVTCGWDRPYILSITAGEEGITIVWTEVPDADGYELSINGEIIDAGETTSYLQTQVQPNFKYVYQVRFLKGTEKSEWSAPQEILTAPDKVANLTAVVINEAAVELAWDAVPGAQTYEIEANGAIVGAATDHTYTHSNPEAAANLIYRVRAVNGELTGEWSDPVSVVSQTIIKRGTITEDTVWDSSLGVYIVQGNITIAEGVTLQVMPGTIIKFMPAMEMTVRGRLAAEGTEEKPIVFTATKDPEYGGSGINSSSDYWKGINVGGTGEFTGEYIKVRFGGNYSGSRNTLNIQGKLYLSHSEVSSSYQDGILIGSGKDVTIQNTIIENSGTNGIKIDKPEITAGNITLIDNVIRNSSNGSGINANKLGEGGFTVERNTIEGNSQYPISISLDRITSSEITQGIASDNIFQGNGYSDSILISGELLVDSTLTENRYTVDDVTIRKTLTLQPGTVLMGNRSDWFIIYGKLTAQGTEEKPIIITSAKDPEYGGSGITKSDDYWRGVYVGSTGEFIGEYVKIKYGGYSSYNYSVFLIVTSSTVYLFSVSVLSTSNSPLINMPERM